MGILLNHQMKQNTLIICCCLPTCLCVYSGIVSARCTHSRCFVRVAQLCLNTTANQIYPCCFLIVQQSETLRCSSQIILHLII